MGQFRCWQRGSEFSSPRGIQADAVGVRAGDAGEGPCLGREAALTVSLCKQPVEWLAFPLRPSHSLSGRVAGEAWHRAINTSSIPRLEQVAAEVLGLLRGWV